MMKVVRVVLSLIFAAQLFVALSTQAQTTNYVTTSGAGSKNGSDWNNAYAGLPSSLVRGRVYMIADGSYGYRTFSDSTSSSTTITVKKATASNHGTDTGWNAATMGSGVASFSGMVFTTAYYVIDGTTRGADWRSGYGIQIRDTSAGKGINLGSGSLSASWGGQNSSAGNIVIRYCELIGADPTNHSSQSHDYGVYGVWGINTVTVSYCYIHDFSHPIITDHDSGWTLEYSVIARNYSTAADHSEGWAAQGDNNVTIRYNVWEDMEGTGFIVNLGRDSYTYSASNWAIYGNVFMCTPGNPYNRTGVGDGTIVCLDDGGNKEYAVNWSVYNNTIVNVSGYSSGVEFGASPVSGVPNNSNVQVFNNFWWNNPAPANNTMGACNSCGIGYNRYDGTSHSSTLSDGNAQVNSSASQSVFVNYTGKDFRLTSATSAGTSLASPYNVDPNNNVRGADGVWDRGAFEFVSGTVITNVPDTTAPSVNLTSPVNGSAVSNTVSVSASASDNVGGSGMSNVVFLVDGSVVGSDTSSPYTYNWSSASVGNGSHTLAVRATDNAGNQSTLSSVNVTVANAVPDTTAPSVNLTSPVNGSAVSNTVSVSASASDNVGGSGVASVSFLVDGSVVGSDTSSPYSFNWNSAGMANGSHTVAARAVDNAGNQTVTSAVTVMVQNQSADLIAPPDLQVVQPF